MGEQCAHIHATGVLARITRDDIAVPLLEEAGAETLPRQFAFAGNLPGLIRTLHSCPHRRRIHPPSNTR